jgi:hypothetical protein
MSTILNAPPPPQNLLFPQKQGIPIEDVSVDVATQKDAISVQAAPVNGEKNEVSVSSQ